MTTLDNLMTFPWIRNRTQRGELQLLGAYFDVASGFLSVYDHRSRMFTPVVDEGIREAAAE